MTQLDDEMPELNNCPFCDCRMTMEVDADGPDYEYGDSGWETATISGQHETELFDCPFSQTEENGITWNLTNFTSLQQVADIWNRRISPPSDQRVVDVETLTNAFLVWPLPKSVCADTCTTQAGYQYPRSGTNLLSHAEAKAFFEHLADSGLLQTTRDHLANAGKVIQPDFKELEKILRGMRARNEQGSLDLTNWIADNLTRKGE